MIDNNNFASFIEELRKSRNFSRKDFVEGIVSERQYYRFIKGESSLTNETISSFLEKLEINPIYAYENFITKKNNDYNILSQSYNALIQHNYLIASDFLSQLNYDEIATSLNRKLYKFIYYTIDFYLEKIPKKLVIDKIIKLVDYPKILNKEMLSFFEMSALTFLSGHLISEREDYKIANYIYNILLNKKVTFSPNLRQSYITFYSTCGKNLGQIGEIEKSLMICNEGIDMCKKFGVLTPLKSLFYFKALGENNLGNNEQCKKTLVKLFSLLSAEDVEEKSKLYKRSIYQNFKVYESDLIIYK